MDDERIRQRFVPVREDERDAPQVPTPFYSRPTVVLAVYQVVHGSVTRDTEYGSVFLRRLYTIGIVLTRTFRE